MTTPTCPTGFECTFTPHNLHPHYYAHWYDGPWGIVLAILTLIALTATIITCSYYAWQNAQDRRSTKQRNIENERARQHELALAEQRTMALDSCKGNPEMLSMAKDMGLIAR